MAMIDASPLDAGPNEQERPVTRGVHEWSAIVLLVAGGLLFGVGWLVGVGLLWTSRAWNLRDKLIGTFVVPGGLLLWLVLMRWVLRPDDPGRIHGTRGWTNLDNWTTLLDGGIVLLALAAPFATAIYLASRADRAERLARYARQPLGAVGRSFAGRAPGNDR